MTCPITSLCLLNGPYAVVNGHAYAVPEGSKRPLVLIALKGAVSRQTAAALLWPGVEQIRAAGNLRSAAWRLRRADLPLLIEKDGALRLSPEVRLDVEAIRAEAAQVVLGRPATDDRWLLNAAVSALDLLPGWYEDWVVGERDRLRIEMLAVIDCVSLQLSRAGRCAEAIDAALVAVTADPLRESSQAALITAHLCEGNIAEARRAFAVYRRAVHRELGLEPAERLARLVGLGTRNPTHQRSEPKRSVPSTA